eukprot:COSAG02_NODE_20_length_53673_cov_86.864841_24_plen_232_part_00
MRSSAQKFVHCARRSTPTHRPHRHRPDTVDDAEAPSTVPPPDDTDAQDPSPFTGALGTGFDGTASTARAQSNPKFNQRVYAYIESLPSRKQDGANKALRHCVYGPGKNPPDTAIEMCKERRIRDAQAPVGSTDFDKLDASDSDAEESDDDTATTQPRRRGPMSQFFSSDTLPARATAPTPDPPSFGSRVDDYFDNLGGSGSTGQFNLLTRYSRVQVSQSMTPGIFRTQERV